MTAEFLKTFFVFFLFFVAIKMFFDRNMQRPERFPRLPIHSLLTFIIGGCSGLLGIGGGVLLLPYLSFCGVPLRKIPGIMALCTLTVSIIGTTIYIWTGWFEPKLPSGCSGYVYWTAVILIAIPSGLIAPLGVRLSYILPVKQLRYVFLILLITTAIHLLPGDLFARLSQH